MDETVSSRRAATRERLLTAAMDVFAHKGIQAASVEEICEAAGFTRGAFYSNFDSKDDLALAMLRDAEAKVLTAAQDAIASLPRDPHRSTEQLIADALRVFQAGHPDDASWLMVRQEVRLYAARNPAIRPALQQAEDELTGLISAALTAAITERGGRVLLPLPQLLLVLDSYCERMSMDTLQRGGTPTGDEWMDGLTRLLRLCVDLP